MEAAWDKGFKGKRLWHEYCFKKKNLLKSATSKGFKAISCNP